MTVRNFLEIDGIIAKTYIFYEIGQKGIYFLTRKIKVHSSDNTLKTKDSNLAKRSQQIYVFICLIFTI